MLSGVTFYILIIIGGRKYFSWLFNSQAKNVLEQSHWLNCVMSLSLDQTMDRARVITNGSIMPMLMLKKVRPGLS